MIKIIRLDDKQFPYVISGIAGGEPQYFTKKAFIELGKLINEELGIPVKAKSIEPVCPECHNEDYYQMNPDCRNCPVSIDGDCDGAVNNRCVIPSRCPKCTGKGE